MNDEIRRLDQWLWYARFFKSRSLATKFCATGKLRVNKTPVSKPHHGLRIGDVLTFPKGDDIRVIEVRDLGRRRGPATEARTLYADLAPPTPRASPRSELPADGRDPGAGRPTKSDRRAIDRLMDRFFRRK
ncbi:MAG: RNA-binding S4 domain-containing protein [Rhodospirillales bacterium]|nr:RNA-binding S4 domain-containing protein [Rhodospirillales bacterium]